MLILMTLHRLRLVLCNTDAQLCREELIGELQSEERERQWHYTQLELISQKLRSLPLTSSLSVSTCRCAG